MTDTDPTAPFSESPLFNTSKVWQPPMRVIFAGMRPLGAEALGLMAELCAEKGRSLVAVLTMPPDDATDWWTEEAGPDIWNRAQSLRLPIISERDLVNQDYDLLFSVYWPKIFPPDVLRRAVLNVNLHTAPLPECRGRYSCSMAILGGDTDFGPTLHLMEEEVDAGPIIARESFPIEDNDTARTLYDKTNQVSVSFLRKWLPKILDGVFSVEDQSEFSRRTGRPIRSFRASELDSYFHCPAEHLTPRRQDLLQRALTFPPRYTAPRWITSPPQIPGST